MPGAGTNGCPVVPSGSPKWNSFCITGTTTNGKHVQQPKTEGPSAPPKTCTGLIYPPAWYGQYCWTE